MRQLRITRRRTPAAVPDPLPAAPRPLDAVRRGRVVVATADQVLQRIDAALAARR